MRTVNYVPPRLSNAKYTTINTQKNDVKIITQKPGDVGMPGMGAPIKMKDFTEQKSKGYPPDSMDKTIKAVKTKMQNRTTLVK